MNSPHLKNHKKGIWTSASATACHSTTVVFASDLFAVTAVGRATSNKSTLNRREVDVFGPLTVATANSYLTMYKEVKVSFRQVKAYSLLAAFGTKRLKQFVFSKISKLPC